MNILFVCSGNICRSPFAEGYFRDRAAAAGLGHVGVDSSGTLGIEDRPPTREAIQASRELKVAISDHRSKGLVSQHLLRSDYVIVMTRDHLEELAFRFPEGQDERLLIRAFEKGPTIDPNALDLPDPMGRSLAFYREQFALIARCLDHFVQFLNSPA